MRDALLMIIGIAVVVSMLFGGSGTPTIDLGQNLTNGLEYRTEVLVDGEPVDVDKESPAPEIISVMDNVIPTPALLELPVPINWHTWAIDDLEQEFLSRGNQFPGGYFVMSREAQGVWLLDFMQRNYPQ